MFGRSKKQPPVRLYRTQEQEVMERPVLHGYIVPDDLEQIKLPFRRIKSDDFMSRVHRHEDALRRGESVGGLQVTLALRGSRYRLRKDRTATVSGELYVIGGDALLEAAMNVMRESRNSRFPKRPELRVVVFLDSTPTFEREMYEREIERVG